MTRLVCTGALFIAIQCCTDPFSGESMAPGQFALLHALIKPKPEERTWEQIPWLVSLWEARQRAAEQGKPILLWEMDGHPLGCT